MPPLSPEFRLVCAACRWPRGPARDAAVRAAVAPGIDWDRTVAIIRRHRVWGLAADGLRAAGVEMPRALSEALKAQAERIAHANLSAAGEIARLGGLLEGSGIDWICFKGMPLAIEAYGTLAVKMANDIDLLVPARDAVRACALLREAGYDRFSPGARVRDDQLAAWMQVSKESGWRHPRTGQIVEMHGRLTANPALIPQASLEGTRRRFTIAPGITVPTMGEEMLFPYLAAHGARDGWFRLKWLADVAALLSQDDAAAIARRYRRAQAAGVGRCGAQALLLAHDLLALPLDPALERELRASRIHRLLVRVALRSMAGKFEAREHTHVGARTMLPVTLSNLLLRRGIGYKWREIASLAANPVDRATGRLPKGLGFLYPVLGGMRWGARMLGLIPARR